MQSEEVIVAIPSYDECFRPVLELATKQDITRATATDAMCAHFKLTKEEREKTMNVSSRKAPTVLGWRVTWVMTYLTKGRLIEKVAPRTYRATEFGKSYLSDHPETISVKDIRKIPGWVESERGKKKEVESETPDTSGTTPLETILHGLESFNDDLKDKLLTEILSQEPAFFERLVLEVLVAMGYGGEVEDAATHTGRSNDEGIDGYIKQDPLGLDMVMVQAKRYRPDIAINRDTIQSFSGAMMGQGVDKGVFITTSYFNANAKDYAAKVKGQKIVLIDGDMLLSLMLKHHVGTRVERTIEILDLDQNYFNDED
jgi:restriction system protein